MGATGILGVQMTLGLLFGSLLVCNVAGQLGLRLGRLVTAKKKSNMSHYTCPPSRRQLTPNRRQLTPNRRQLTPNRRQLTPHRRELTPN